MGAFVPGVLKSFLLPGLFHVIHRFDVLAKGHVPTGLRSETTKLVDEREGFIFLYKVILRNEPCFLYPAVVTVAVAPLRSHRWETAITAISILAAAVGLLARLFHLGAAKFVVLLLGGAELLSARADPEFNVAVVCFHFSSSLFAEPTCHPSS